ncbi:MAG TPA: ATP-binding protein [Thermoanaerobaculia bacterium]|nr:ATP-binding protein [Thermoanaerobaculia bacterium]
MTMHQFRPVAPERAAASGSLLLVSRSPGLPRVLGLEGLARRAGLELVETGVVPQALAWIASRDVDLALVLVDQAVGEHDLELLIRRAFEAGRAAVVLGRRPQDQGRAFELGAADWIELDLVAPEGAAVSLERVLALRRQASEVEHWRARFRRIFETCPIGLFELDEDGRLLAANAELARALGVSAASLPGRTIQDLEPGLDWDAELRSVASYCDPRADSPALLYEVRLVRGDGGQVAGWLGLRRGTAFGAPVCFEGWFLDRSREMALLEATQRSEALYVELFSAMAEPTVVVDSGGVVLACNEGGERLLARPATELVGRPLQAAVGGLLEADGTEVVPNGEEVGPLEVLLRGRGERYLGLVRHDRSVVWATVRVRAVPTPGEEGRGHRLVSFLDDTENRELRLRAQGVELDTAVAIGAAHDARNLLTVVRAAAELIQRDAGVATGAVELATQIEQAAGRASELVNRFASLLRSCEPRREHYHVDPILLGVRGLLETVVKGTAQLRFDLDAPAATLLGEPLELERAVFNLVLNARDAMTGGGSIRVSTRCAPAGDGRSDGVEGSGWLLLAVEDDGCGMADEVRERATQRYFTTRETAGGSGLGLYNVARFAHSQGGRIEIDSGAARGTTVRLWLPVVSAVAS